MQLLTLELMTAATKQINESDGTWQNSYSVNLAF
jgi:hypothetical protein